MASGAFGMKPETGEQELGLGGWGVVDGGGGRGGVRGFGRT